MASKKLLLGLVIIGLVLVASATVPIMSVEYDTTEPYETTETYQEEVQREVNYDYEVVDKYYDGDLGLDFEVDMEIKIKNLENQGGVFEVTFIAKEGSETTYYNTKRERIPPGQTVTFTDETDGVKYSSDWTDRYDFSYNIEVPTKIETDYVTKERTVTKERVITKTKRITIFKYLSGDYKG